MTKLYTQKVTKSGNYYEVRNYERPVGRGFAYRGTHAKRAVCEKRSDNISRAKFSLIRKIMANSKKCKPLFLTLTYATCMTDREQIISDLHRWIRLIRESRRFSYVYALELQERGAWHAHIAIFDAVYIDVDYLRGLWQDVVDEYARVHIRTTESAQHVGFYLAKYLGKDEDRGHKRTYSSSRGLLSSEECYYLDMLWTCRYSAEVVHHDYYFTPQGGAVELIIYYDP